MSMFAIHLHGMKRGPVPLSVVQLVQASMVSSVVLFGLAIVGLDATGAIEPAEMVTLRILPPLSIANAAVAAVGIILAVAAPRVARRFQKTVWEINRPAEDSIERVTYHLARAHFTARIVQLGAMESAGLFGLVVCLLAAMAGRMQQSPMYWLNTAPAVVFLAYVVATFPTRGRIERSLLFAREVESVPRPQMDGLEDRRML